MRESLTKQGISLFAGLDPTATVQNAYRAILADLGEPTDGTLADLRTRVRGLYAMPHLAGMPDDKFDAWAQGFAERKGWVKPPQAPAGSGRIGETWASKSGFREPFVVVAESPAGLELVGTGKRNASKRMTIPTDRLEAEYEKKSDPEPVDEKKRDSLVKHWRQSRNRLEKYLAEYTDNLNAATEDKTKRYWQGRVNGILRRIADQRKKIEAHAKSVDMTRQAAAKEFLPWESESFPQDRQPVRPAPTGEAPEPKPEETSQRQEVVTRVALEEVERVADRISKGKRFESEEPAGMLRDLIRHAGAWGHRGLENLLLYTFGADGVFAAEVQDQMYTSREKYYGRRQNRHNITEEVYKHHGGKLKTIKLATSRHKLNLPGAQKLEADDATGEWKPYAPVKDGEFVVPGWWYHALLNSYSDAETGPLFDQMASDGTLSFVFPGYKVPVSITPEALKSLIVKAKFMWKFAAGKWVDYTTAQGPAIMETNARAGDNIEIRPHAEDGSLKPYYPRMREGTTLSKEDADNLDVANAYGMHRLDQATTMVGNSRFHHRERSTDPFVFANPWRMWNGAIDKADRYIEMREASKMIRSVLEDKRVENKIRTRIPEGNTVYDLLKEQLRDFEYPEPPRVDDFATKAADKLTRNAASASIALRPQVWAIQPMSAISALGRVPMATIKYFVKALNPANRRGLTPITRFIDENPSLFERYIMSSPEALLTEAPVDNETGIPRSTLAYGLAQLKEKTGDITRLFDKLGITRLKDMYELEHREKFPQQSEQAVVDAVGSKLAKLIETTQASRLDMGRAPITIAARKNPLLRPFVMYINEQMHLASSIDTLRVMQRDGVISTKEFITRSAFILLSNALLVLLARWGIRLGIQSIGALIYAFVNGERVDESMRKMLVNEFRARKTWPFWVKEILSSVIGLRVPIMAQAANIPLDMAANAAQFFVRGGKGRVGEAQGGVNLLESYKDRAVESADRLSRLLVRPKWDDAEWRGNVLELIGSGAGDAIGLATGLGVPGVIQGARDIKRGYTGVEEYDKIDGGSGGGRSYRSSWQ
jgi:hypothetical protein